MKTTFITQRWQTGDPERDSELAQCAHINRLLFGDGYLGLLAYTDRRMTFGDLMQRATPGLNIIANSDIYLSSASLATVVEYYTRHGTDKVCMALSRWDVAPDGLACSHYAHRDSQDTFIFKGLPPRALVTAADSCPIGVPGTDNRLCAIFAEHGYSLINPSRTVRTFHLHNSGYRTYGTGRGGTKRDTVPGPYVFVTPSTL